MSDTESSIGVTPGTGQTFATVLRGGKHIQKLVPSGVGGTVLSSAVTATTSATALPTTALTDRKTMLITNLSGTVIVYLGGSGVTTTAGTPLGPDSAVSLDLSDGATIYGIVSTGTAELRVLEAS